MQKKVKKLMKELSKLIYHSASNYHPDVSPISSGQYIDDSELEIMKESINQLRQDLNLLVVEPERELVSEEVLRVSRALDELISDYHKAFAYFKKVTPHENQMPYQHQDSSY